MQKKLTITINEKIYEALHKTIGRGKISQFIESLLRPHVLDSNLEAEYRLMAEDKVREKEALDWSESLFGEIENDKR